MPLIALLLALLAGCGPAPPPATGRPERVVVLAPSATEIVYALGEGGRVVGVCDQCDWPREAAARPHVGGWVAPSVEAVLAAQPDLVVVVPSPGNREAVRAIERAGIRVLVVGERTLDDLWRAIADIARTLAVPERGAGLTARVQASLDAVRARVAGRPPRRTLIVVGHRPLVVVGGATLQDQLLRVAGGVNVVADVGDAFPQIGLETVVARAPEVIVDAAMGTEQGADALFGDLGTVPAVAAKRVVPFAPDTLFRAGPRVDEAAAALARVLHPEVADTPPG